MSAPERTLDSRLALSADPPSACARCAGTAFTAGEDGGTYCSFCAARRPAGRDRAEFDFGHFAGASDIGHRHEHNEDGFALASFGSAYAGVVCDGVSTSSRADTASHAAAAAAVQALVRALPAGPVVPRDTERAAGATLAAIAAAQAAAAAVGGDGAACHGAGSAAPPSTTLVSAIITGDGVTIGWVGDSRAYWVGDDGSARRLTVDDTLAGQLAAAGVEIREDAPNAGALIQWLGANAGEPEPHVVIFQPERPGRIVVCSDGLYRYAPEAEDMAAVVQRLTGPTAMDTVRGLIRFALDSGGIDNVTVILLPYGLGPWG